MIDIHPPHESVHTWRDFLIHIATIVIGLLIAIGLEQTVELFHHRHQVAETRQALQREINLDIQLFAIQTDEFHRFAPRLLTDVAVLHYLRDHPHASPQQRPGTIDLSGLYMVYRSTAWRAAQQSGVLNYMPAPEVTRFGRIYDALQHIGDLESSYREAIFQVRAVFISQPDPSQFTPAQIEIANTMMAQLLVRKALSASTQLAVASYYPEFGASPTQADINKLLGISMSKEESDSWASFHQRTAAAYTEYGSAETR